jgi:hypothetical protein
MSNQYHLPLPHLPHFGPHHPAPAPALLAAEHPPQPERSTGSVPSVKNSSSSSRVTASSLSVYTCRSSSYAIGASHTGGARGRIASCRRGRCGSCKAQRTSIWVCILMMRALRLILNGSDNEKCQGKKKGKKEGDDIPWQNDRRKPRHLEPSLPF